MDFAHFVAVKCIYVFLLFPEVLFSGTVQKCCFLALCQIICLFMYFYYFQKFRHVVFWHCARLFVYLCISIISRSSDMLFSGTVPDYLFIYGFLLFPEVQTCCFLALCQIICLFMYFFYVFLLFPEVQKCYVFWHCALCTGSSQGSVFETDITMS